MWLYQRYKYRIPKNDPLHTSQYTLPLLLLHFLHSTFHITHSYFSSPLTCSTQLKTFFSPFPHDLIFGSLGTSFQYKWQGLGYAHPHTEQDIQQAIHWARLAAHHDPMSLTILITPNKNWYTHEQHTPTSFSDTHILARFEADTVTYHEPTNPLAIHEPIIEPNTLYIFCIHHQQTPIHSVSQLQELASLFHTLNIQHTTLHPIGPTPDAHPPNPSSTWTKLVYPPNPSSLPTPPPLPNYNITLPQKFLPQHSYYTDGSFKPPKLLPNNTWRRERAGYSIYNSSKNIHISAHLPGLPNILRAELMALHHTIQLLNSQYSHELAAIFTDSLTSLYLLKIQLTHPILHNNHPDKTILASMAHMLQTRTHPLSLHKVCAHINISGNDHADRLAKDGTTLPHRNPRHDYEHAHPTPYYLHKDTWPSMEDTPYKGPIRHLDPYLKKYDKHHNLQTLTNSFPNIAK
jgi:ribonuclease HI